MATRSDRAARVAVAVFRLAPAIAPLSLLPQLADLLVGLPGALDALHDGAADALGVGALFTLAASFAVTPIRTLTGWRWHLILRRDLGLWAAGCALAELLIAAAASGLTGVAGKAFLAAGTLAALLLVPLVVTSNRGAMRALGRRWKSLHRLVYVVIVLVTLHLVLLEGARGLLECGLLFGPSLLLRVGPVRRWVTATRKRLARRRAVPA